MYEPRFELEKVHEQSYLEKKVKVQIKNKKGGESPN